MSDKSTEADHILPYFTNILHTVCCLLHADDAGRRSMYNNPMLASSADARGHGGVCTQGQDGEGAPEQVTTLYSSIKILPFSSLDDYLLCTYYLFVILTALFDGILLQIVKSCRADGREGRA